MTPGLYIPQLSGSGAIWKSSTSETRFASKGWGKVRSSIVWSTEFPWTVFVSTSQELNILSPTGGFMFGRRSVCSYLQGSFLFSHRRHLGALRLHRVLACL